ncbi:MAG: hypothetical protein JNM93_01180, partial [Bacteriovoracaceae bacterium]|nr:hypothetical protein [Bacteriovoracaceae bacterium]
YFFQDLEFLTTKGVNLKGKKLPVDLALKYIENSSVTSLGGFRGMAKKALFELELWNYDFSQPGAKTFLERAVEVGEALDKEFLIAGSERASTSIDHWANFMTVHHWGRNIRYIGYFLAEASSMMNAQFLWSKFQQETGRKSLNLQPTLAKLLAEGYYKKGFELPFPLAVEKFTGEPFAFDNLIRSEKELIEKHIDGLNCDKHL